MRALIFIVALVVSVVGGNLYLYANNFHWTGLIFCGVWGIIVGLIAGALVAKLEN